jgi:YegS/Rv2252/BmrU family lipid kinase
MSAQVMHFISNPIAGGMPAERVEEYIRKFLNPAIIIPEFHYTEYAGHGYEMARDLAASGAQFVVAVGGDGTAHEVGAALIGTETALGIIPNGSGNGFARHLKIPLQFPECVEALNRLSLKMVDTGEINGQPFLNVAGIGFDAEVAELFAERKRTGFWGYASIILKRFAKAKNKFFELELDTEVMRPKALMICFANGAQFGNRAYIAPKASTSDGYMEVCILRKPLWLSLPFFLWHMFNKHTDRSRYLKTYRTREVVVRHSGTIFQADGEVFPAPPEFRVRILPSSLHVLVQK